MDAKRPCPDSALLAAFIDGTLVDDDRSAVVAHLTECGACRCTADNVAAFQEMLEREHSWESAASPRKAIKVTKSRPRRLWTREQTRVIALTLAGAAALAVVLYPLTSMMHDEPASSLTELVNASGGPRPITARVSGFQYGRPPALRPTPAEERGRWRLTSAAGRIRETYEDDPLSTSQHAVGVAALLVGSLDDAVSSLYRAAAAAPSDPRILNDLAAAYYERAISTDHADDLPRALSFVERSLVHSADSPDTWFNRALIITSLGLRTQARDAWNVYLQKDRTSPWAAEARERLATLSARPGANDWAGIRQKLETAPDQGTVDEAVRRFASRVREYFDREVLSAWAVNVERGENASVILQRATMIGDSFFRLTGDDTYSDALAVIRRVTNERDQPQLLALARAHRDYAGGLRLVAEPQIGEAGAALRRAESVLSAFGSPLGLRARIEIAGTEYLLGRGDTAQKPLSEIKAAALAGDYSNLVVRVEWLTGLIAFTRNDFGAAQIAYEGMLQAASAVGDIEQVAFAHGLLANLHDTLGDVTSAWRHRIDAAAILDDVSTPLVAANLLLSAAGDASMQGYHYASLVFNSALLGLELPINPILEVQALTQRSRTLNRIGRNTEALDSLRLARSRISGISDRVIVDRIEPDLLAADAEIFRRSDPSRAIAAAERALTLPVVRRDPLRLARFSLSLAEAALDRHELDRADAAIQHGIAALEAFRNLPSAEVRIRTSDASWSLFVKAMQVALLRGDVARAFEYSERRRMQTSFEHQRWKPVVSLGDLQRQLPADTAVAVLNQMDDHLQVWIIRQQQVHQHTVAITSGQAPSLVTSHLYELASNTPTPKVTGDLFDAVFLPGMPTLSGLRNLVVVADSPYHRIAFASLWDRRRDRYLLEDRAIVAAPSATAYVSALARGREIAGDGVRHAVIIESPTAEASTESKSDARSRLDERQVAALYTHAEVWRGEAATAERLLHTGHIRDVIHVAAPLQPNEEFPFLSRLLLVDTPGRKHSGAVFARHVADTELSHARLVTFEHRGERTMLTGQGALGFSRALLAAGVPNVVGAIAAVKAPSLERIWLDFHRHYVTGLSAAESLRQAQLTALSESNHRPGPWAMLTVFGSTR